MAGYFMTKIKTELIAFKMAGVLIYDYLFNPNLYQVSNLRQFGKTFFQLVYERLTNSGKNIDDVAEEALGKGNYTALSGKVAIVTGANSGLGLQNARVLMKYGCHVIWAVRNPAKAQKALDALEADKLTGKVTMLQVDISDLTTVKPFVESFLALGLPLHYLVLNAGIMATPTRQETPQGFELQVGTNHFGHFWLTKKLW